MGIVLPPKATTPLGGPIFYIMNQSGTNTVTIKDGDTMATIMTLAINSAVAVTRWTDGITEKWILF